MTVYLVELLHRTVTEDKFDYIKEVKIFLRKKTAYRLLNRASDDTGVIVTPMKLEWR